jgi:hypothetical protein
MALRGRSKRIEVATTTGSHDDVLGVKILDRETIRVKFNRASIILSKFADGNKILDKVRCMKNIMQEKGI